MKAVIMAGGEGRRLRPLTCTLPKPMARILGKPIVEYIFELLISAGITEASVTLGYLPHMIEERYESGYKNLKLNFAREDKPLGTAGGVKNAAASFNEPFIVISGDAVCDFDLEKIVSYHKARGAQVTVVAVEASDPREYGIITVDKENRITGFIEKPSWTQAISNLANTGIYIINPECLDLIPKGESFDFASDLFPMMLEKDMPVYCYHADGYWCDAGNIEAYLKCHRDAFDGKIKTIKPANNYRLPDGDYTVIPPVYISSDVEISSGAVIGPYAVIDGNCSVGENAKIRYSVVSENSFLAAETSVTGAVVCSGAALKKGASMFENSVAGAGSVIGVNANIYHDVLIWPGKIIGSGLNVRENVKYGSLKAGFFSDNGLSEEYGAVISPETCVRFGSAVASSADNVKIGIATDGSYSAEILKLALVSGMADSGGRIWDFGECIESELEFLVNTCSLDFGLFVSSEPFRSIRLCSSGGLNITRAEERKIENAFSKCEFRHAQETVFKEITDMSGMSFLYVKEILKNAPDGLSGIGAALICDNKRIVDVLKSCFSELGADENSDLIFRIDSNGRMVSAETPLSVFSYEKLLSVCCMNEFRNGRDVSVPYDAPEYLDAVAAKFGRKVHRYLNTPADTSDSYARKLAAKQIFVRDGLILAVKLLAIIKERNLNLGQLINELPMKYIIRKTFEINFSPSYFSTLMGEDLHIGNGAEGLKFFKDEGVLLIVPEKSGERIRVLAEADTIEAADELCADVEEILGKANDNI